MCAQAVLWNQEEASVPAAESERGDGSCQGHAGPGSHLESFALCSEGDGAVEGVRLEWEGHSLTWVLNRQRQNQGDQRGVSVVVQVGDDGASDQGGGEKRTDSGSALKVRPRDSLMDWVWVRESYRH